jgi:glyoxylase-like metal-dependent hydrolase (beta-lactamase superfamily II)
MTTPIEVHRTQTEARIYRIPLHLFPELFGYAHLVLKDDFKALIDVGSGFGDCNQELDEGLSRVRQDFGEDIGWEQLTHVLISHGHIDHFGGLGFVREKSNALVGVHELDRRVLTHYEERRSVVTQAMRQFLIEAGVEEEYRQEVLNVYLLHKYLFTSVEVDFTFESQGMKIGPMDLLHVPGHCPGHVTFQIDEFLLAGDHILERTSPHQAPERLSSHTGLAHYLESLEKVRAHSGSIECTLGGHEAPIWDLNARIDEIEGVHVARLRQILNLLDQPHSVAEISETLFHEVHAYHKVLALEEAGAHAEYLVQRGALVVDNLEDLNQDRPTARRYRKVAPLEEVLPPWMLDLPPEEVSPAPIRTKSAPAH